MSIRTPREVLDFWIEAGPGKWWKKDAEFDAAIAARFTKTYEAACRGDLDAWSDSADGAMALILLLDQFSRNLHRNSALAYAQDEKCREISMQMVEDGNIVLIQDEIRAFSLLPLMHSESLADQELALELLKVHGKEGNVKAAIEHRDIIARFGRFPHRNAVLGRETSPEEQAFLDDGGFSG